MWEALDLLTGMSSISELTTLVREIYSREWTPSSEQQLAHKIREKGGVKFVENNDAALSELSHLDNAKSENKVLLFDLR